MNKIAILLCAMSMSGSAVLAQDAGKQASPNKKMPQMTAEQRQKMADAHEKMAACMRSDKPMKECHEEMMKACHEGMGKEGCPMMGGKGKGMHGHKMMHKDKEEQK